MPSQVASDEPMPDPDVNEGTDYQVDEDGFEPDTDEQRIRVVCHVKSHTARSRH